MSKKFYTCPECGGEGIVLGIYEDQWGIVHDLEGDCPMCFGEGGVSDEMWDCYCDTMELPHLKGKLAEVIERAKEFGYIHEDKE